MSVISGSSRCRLRSRFHRRRVGGSFDLPAKSFEVEQDDPPAFHRDQPLGLQLAEGQGHGFPADPDQPDEATYGVAFQMGIHTEWSNRPATFLIDRDGVIRFERRGTAFNDRPKPADILKEIDTLGKDK